MEFIWRSPRYFVMLPSTENSKIESNLTMNGTPPAGLVVPKTPGLAITSLVLGILGIVVFCLGPIFFAIPAIICGHIAHSKIKNSGGQLTGAGVAIGGFVTGYVSLALLALMLPIAIPNFIKARQVTFQVTCKKNLQLIDDAKQAWVKDHPDKKNTVPTSADLDTYLPQPGGFSALKCPTGGTYDIKLPNVAPTCSKPEHHLD
jgi:hypothetical protein